MNPTNKSDKKHTPRGLRRLRCLRASELLSVGWVYMNTCRHRSLVDLDGVVSSLWIWALSAVSCDALCLSNVLSERIGDIDTARPICLKSPWMAYRNYCPKISVLAMNQSWTRLHPIAADLIENSQLCTWWASTRNQCESMLAAVVLEEDSIYLAASEPCLWRL